jgi:hypothetical protein
LTALPQDPTQLIAAQLAHTVSLLNDALRCGGDGG